MGNAKEIWNNKEENKKYHDWSFLWQHVSYLIWDFDAFKKDVIVDKRTVDDVQT